MENVGFFQIVQLVGLADELPGRETAVGQMLEEHLVGDKARHGHHLPSGPRHEYLAQRIELRNAVGADRQVPHALHKRVAGPPGQQG
ncbi:Uncharacterised protein [Mycobacteroides abscessus subsp. abscessus]|nr:Uncharacterised protein [Mycobacteroides abscessus subsp. abscessus]